MLINHSDPVEEVNTHIHSYTSIEQASKHIIMNKIKLKCDDDDEEYEVRHQSSSSTAMETCLDDLNSFKEVSALCYVLYFAYFLLTDSSISRFLFFSFKHRCVCLMIVVSLHFLRLIRIHPVWQEAHDWTWTVKEREEKRVTRLYFHVNGCQPIHRRHLVTFGLD